MMRLGNTDKKTSRANMMRLGNTVKSKAGTT
jgi:hypothetical protein